jgi:hypothetical protein
MVKKSFAKLILDGAASMGHVELLLPDFQPLLLLSHMVEEGQQQCELHTAIP